MLNRTPFIFSTHVLLKQHKKCGIRYAPKTKQNKKKGSSQLMLYSIYTITAINNKQQIKQKLVISLKKTNKKCLLTTFTYDFSVLQLRKHNHPNISQAAGATRKCDDVKQLLNTCTECMNDGENRKQTSGRGHRCHLKICISWWCENRNVTLKMWLASFIKKNTAQFLCINILCRNAHAVL